MLPKSENKPSGLRRFFSRKKRSSRSTQDSTIPSEAARHTEQKEARQSRQSYRPRYADRDMILSVPVEQRPDLVVRAKEASLQRACSDIGFNTIASSSRSSFATASSSSQTQSDVSMHPILQQRRQVTMQTRTAASSDVDSLSHHSGRMSGYSRSISMPSTLLKQTGCATENYWRGMNLGPRGKTAQLDDAQIERVDHALKKIGRLESERASEQHLTSLSSPGAGYAANANHRLTAASSSSPRQSRLYFGHSNTAPDLRATRDKGKGRAVESQGQYNHGTLLSSSPYCLEARQSYAISHAVLTPDSDDSGPQHTRDPSLTDSDDSRQTRDAWSKQGTPRTGSVNTTLTSVSSHSGSQTMQPENEEPGSRGKPGMVKKTSGETVGDTLN